MNRVQTYVPAPLFRAIARKSRASQKTMAETVRRIVLARMDLDEQNGAPVLNTKLPMVQLTMSFTDEDWDRLQGLAQGRHVTLAQYIREAVTQQEWRDS